MCVPIPGTPRDVTIRTTTWGLSDKEIDPKQVGVNYGIGLAASNFLPDFVLKILHMFWEVVDWIIAQFFSGYDELIGFVASQVSVALGRDRPGFWILIGSLISDLLGVNLDGTQLFGQLQSRGTLAAMQGVGHGLIDLLIGEFTGTATGTGGTVTFGSAVNAETGLPEATLTPKGGLLAAKALMGFVLSSAVRQANIDGFFDMIPAGYGKPFERYSEAMRTNLGIGRMMRFALKPIFQDLVATPMKWAINKQYRPTLLSPADAWSAWVMDNSFDVNEEMARHGYSDARRAFSQWIHLKTPTYHELRDLRIHTDPLMPADDYKTWMHRLGYTDEVIAILDKAADLRVARVAVLREAETAAVKYLSGTYTQPQFAGLISSLQNDLNGYPLLSAGEVHALLSLPAHPTTAPRRHLGVAPLMLLYMDGLITLQEFEADIRGLGFSDDAVAELVQLVLVKARAKQEKEAAAAAKAAAAEAKAAAAAGGQPPGTTP